MTGDAGQNIDPRGMVDGGKVQITRIQRQRARGCQRKGRLAQLNRINAQQQMVHDRVADKDQFIDRLGVHLGLGRDGLDQPVQRRAHGGGHFAVAAGVHHRIRHPRHQILAKADLRVHHPGRCQNRAVAQVAQMRRDGGRTQINRQTQQLPLMIAGPDIQNAVTGVVVALVQGDRHLPLTLAQNRLQTPHQAEFGGNPLDLPLVLQGAAQPFKITRRFVHVRFVNFDVQKPGGRVHDDVAHGGGFADDLFVDLRFRWHVNHDVALHLRLTAQTATIDHAADAFIARLNLIPVGQGPFVHGDAVFGKFTVTGADLTFGTDAAATADRIQIDAQLTGGGQNRRTKGKTAAFARGGENDQSVVRHGQAPVRRDVLGADRARARVVCGRGAVGCVTKDGAGRIFCENSAFPDFPAKNQSGRWSDFSQKNRRARFFAEKSSPERPRLKTA